MSTYIDIIDTLSNFVSNQAPSDADMINFEAAVANAPDLEAQRAFDILSAPNRLPEMIAGLYPASPTPVDLAKREAFTAVLACKLRDDQLVQLDAMIQETPTLDDRQKSELMRQVFAYADAGKVRDVFYLLNNGQQELDRDGRLARLVRQIDLPNDDGVKSQIELDARNDFLSAGRRTLSPRQVDMLNAAVNLVPPAPPLAQRHPPPPGQGQTWITAATEYPVDIAHPTTIAARPTSRGATGPFDEHQAARDANLAYRDWSRTMVKGDVHVNAKGDLEIHVKPGDRLWYFAGAFMSNPTDYTKILNGDGQSAHDGPLLPRTTVIIPKEVIAQGLRFPRV